MNDPNPYASPVPIEKESGTFSIGGHRAGVGLLHRRILFKEPFEAELDYDGKYFRQRLLIGKHLVWYRISWLTIHRKIEFTWPRDYDENESPGRIEIVYGPGFKMKRFAVFLNETVIYDEVNGVI